MIALYHGTSFMSRIIRARTWSQYSHCSYIAPSFNLEIEAWRGGVTAVTVPFTNHTPGTRVDLFEFLDTDGVDQAMTHFLRQQVGKPYDFPGIIGFVTRRAQGMAKFQDRWFCSELVFAAAQHARKDLLARVPAWKVTPAMIAYSPILRFVRSCIVPDYSKMRSPESGVRDPESVVSGPWSSASSSSGGACGCPPEPDEALFV